MFKFFKRKEVKEPAPSGEDRVHYEWRDHCPCPICNRDRIRRKELAEDERKARLLGLVLLGLSNTQRLKLTY